jgi:DMSO/TMAO reductase YedYZ heme-binding membrane subunit
VLLLMFVFWQINWGGENPYGDRFWNVVMAYISLVLLCLILILGPLARFVRRVRPMVPWGRELGIGMFVTGGLHLLILLEGGDGSWDFFGFFFEANPFSVTVEWTELLRTDIWTAANWLGLFALGYALVLAATSNDWSQRLLGRGWKFVQRQAYTLFVLVWLHTVVWVLIGHGNDFKGWFWVFTTAVFIAQVAGFVHTVRLPRGPSPQMPHARPDRPSRGAATARAARWIGVIGLWGGLIVGTLSLGLGLSPELAQFCERYHEVKHLPQSEMIEELSGYLPWDDPSSIVQDTLETVEHC